MAKTSVSAADAEFEREKWAAELRIREREIAVKEREQDTKDRELQSKIREEKRARWTNPLVLAVLAASLAAAGNAAVALINGILQRSVEETRAVAQNSLETRKADAEQNVEEAKAEAARILEVIKTNDPDKAAVNLDFLLQTGLIANSRRRESLASFLEKRKPGQGPVLPAGQTSSPLSGSFSYVCYIKDNGNAEFVLAQLTETLKNSGRGGFNVGKEPSNNPSNHIWVSSKGGEGFAIMVNPSASGAVNIDLYPDLKRRRPDDEVLGDKSANYRELVLALVRLKLREIAVDPSCAS
jgi:hypothetical protein